MRGDTLSKTAKESYDDESEYPAIFEASQPMLKSSDLIYPGRVLRIPPLDAWSPRTREDPRRREGLLHSGGSCNPGNLQTAKLPE